MPFSCFVSRNGQVFGRVWRNPDTVHLPSAPTPFLLCLTSPPRRRPVCSASSPGGDKRQGPGHPFTPPPHTHTTTIPFPLVAGKQSSGVTSVLSRRARPVPTENMPRAAGDAASFFSPCMLDTNDIMACMLDDMALLGDTVKRSHVT